jgi:hypothetical protein
LAPSARCDGGYAAECLHPLTHLLRNFQDSASSISRLPDLKQFSRSQTP